MRGGCAEGAGAEELQVVGRRECRKPVRLGARRRERGGHGGQRLGGGGWEGSRTQRRLVLLSVRGDAKLGGSALARTMWRSRARDFARARRSDRPTMRQPSRRFDGRHLAAPSQSSARLRCGCVSRISRVQLDVEMRANLAADPPRRLSDKLTAQQRTQTRPGRRDDGAGSARERSLILLRCVWQDRAHCAPLATTRALSCGVRGRQRRAERCKDGRLGGPRARDATRLRGQTRRAAA